MQKYGITRLVHIINILFFNSILFNFFSVLLKPFQNLLLRDFYTCLFNGFRDLGFDIRVALKKACHPFVSK